MTFGISIYTKGFWFHTQTFNVVWPCISLLHHGRNHSQLAREQTTYGACEGEECHIREFCVVDEIIRPHQVTMNINTCF